MKVSGLSTDSKKEVANASLKCAEQLYKELFIWSEKSENTSIVNNTLLVHLGLIKVSHNHKIQNIVLLFLYFYRVKIKNLNLHGTLKVASRHWKQYLAKIMCPKIQRMPLKLSCKGK